MELNDFLDLLVKEGFQRIKGANKGQSKLGLLENRTKKLRKVDQDDLLGPVGLFDNVLLRETLAYVYDLIDGLTVPIESSYIPEFEEMVKLMTLSKKVIGH